MVAAGTEGETYVITQVRRQYVSERASALEQSHPIDHKACAVVYQVVWRQPDSIQREMCLSLDVLERFE